MKAIIAATLLGLCFVMSSQAQSPESHEAAYKAYLGDQKAEVTKELWKKVVSDRQNEFDKSNNDKNALYQLALAQFGLLSATMRDRDEDLFDDYADQAEDNLESLIDKNKNWGEPRALLSALYGLKMGYSPWKGMYLGSKSQNLMDKAMKDAPLSPLVWKLYANSKYFTPETWGGDIKEAVSAYEKSIQLYESNALQTKNNWFYIDTMAFLGQAYVKDGQHSKAIAIYEKALTLEPAFGWIKFSLLPKAKKSVASN
ncbi:MAG: hypothetical protein ACOYXT_11195 [Bacteroidota bacterium]